MRLVCGAKVQKRMVRTDVLDSELLGRHLKRLGAVCVDLIAARR